MMTLFLKSLKFSGNYLNNSAYTGTVVNANTDYAFRENVFKADVARFTAQAEDAWVDFGASAVDFFKSYAFKEIIFTLKTISFILSLLALAAIIFIFFKMRALGKTAQKAKEAAEGKGKIKKILKKWAKIEKKIKSDSESNYKLAVLEADNLYDEILRGIGYDKEKELSSLDEIRNAKKIKKSIIDDSGFMLTREMAENSLNAYKKGLEELGVL